MEPELHGRADQAQAEGHEDEVCGPQGVQAVLGLPDAAVARREPQGDAVAEEVAVDEADHEAGPVDEREGGVLRDGEAVDAPGLERHLQPDWREGVEGDVEAEGYGVEAGDDQDDWGEHHLEWLDKHFALRGSQSTRIWCNASSTTENLTMSPQDTPAPTLDPKKNVS